MNILKLMGNNYPKFKSEVYSDGTTTTVTVYRTLHPDHVDLDSPSYVENKFRKQVPILKAIGVSRDEKTSEQTIAVDVSVPGKFNSFEAIKDLVGIASAVAGLAEDKLSEPEVLKNIGLDCKPFIINDDESEETAQTAPADA